MFTASSSSLPVFLACALASILIWSSALGCHPPKGSTGRGRNMIPLPPYGKPGGSAYTSHCRQLLALVAESAILLGRRGPTSVTLIVVSLPPVQLGMNTSPGLALLPGRRLRSSFLEPGCHWLLLETKHPSDDPV